MVELLDWQQIIYLLQANELLQAAKVNQNQNEKMTQLNEALKVGDVINESSINTKIKVSFLMQLNSA